MAKKRRSLDLRGLSARSGIRAPRSQKPPLQAVKPSTLKGSLLSTKWMFDGLVGDGIKLSIAEVQSLRLGAIERARSSPAKNRELIAGFVHGAVAVDAFGNSECRTPCPGRSDQFRRGTRAEAGEMRGVVP